MRSNNNSVPTLQYHIVWCTKYRHPILTGAVEVETKTILAQTCTEYGWSLKAIEVMPDHVHLFLEASPDEAPSTIARTLKSISAVHIFTAFPRLKERKFWGSGLWSRGCYYGSVGAVTEGSTLKTRNPTLEVPNDEVSGMRQGNAQRNGHIVREHAIQHECHIQV